MPEYGKQRLGYIDWMRGLACLLMFQYHCYDSWLGGAARQTRFSGLSKLGGTLPAPLFLFLAGISCALLSDRMRRKGVPLVKIAKTFVRRGAEIFALGLLFRVQEFVLGQPWAPWTDLLRVDILNTIGLALIFMGILCGVARTLAASAIWAAVVALAISMFTPPLWTTWRPDWLPWYLESYINGVHNLHVPQPWLFPIFPWVAFAFAGLAIGSMIFGDWAVKNASRALALVGIAGVGLFFLSQWLDSRRIQIYSVYDYWHTSPNFFLARVGILLVIMWAVYAWCQGGLGEAGFSPLIKLGQASLLVYWVHIEFVYGRFSILAKQAQTIPAATLGFLAILVAMVLLATMRIRLKGHGAEILAWFRRSPKPAPNT